MATDKLSIQPVWGIGRRKLSSDVLDTAETLVENLDNLADVLDKLADKYDMESKAINTAYRPDETTAVDSNKEAKAREVAETNLFQKLKTGLDSARSLIGCLRREKGRLMKREMSVECRLGEIEDYKSHMKQDLTSLNEMVDILTVRVCEAETQLCEEQEKTECLQSEKDDLEQRLKRVEQLYTDVTMDNDKMIEENKQLRKERTNTSLKLENKEIKYKIEMLLVENEKLKEMVRKDNEEEVTLEGDLGTTLPDLIEDNNNNCERYVSVSEESD